MVFAEQELLSTLDAEAPSVELAIDSPGSNSETVTMPPEMSLTVAVAEELAQPAAQPAHLRLPLHRPSPSPLLDPPPPKQSQLNLQQPKRRVLLSPSAPTHLTV